ncbi:hypothetical protein RRG08_010418 [Elysia crispata]|uniref:Uncharacterized protein n=1 Tax=Elysia crispata TaxID=231223 RepID=A0AAE0YSF9_9GAST|nr:hypothetical protein RRG08_010418 [Elysia crispata]
MNTPISEASTAVSASLIVMKLTETQDGTVCRFITRAWSKLRSHYPFCFSIVRTPRLGQLNQVPLSCLRASSETGVVG